ncbi:winged helix-turn-helix transcriptional regulator [Nonomuraea glycinis]|uniref:winged helix-turn-helix transcriptional regulator n=1 Tax=Nonomuraea glycinis TaxID=2047744 RepID=UPI002E15150B|nr:winged helix-turn-helix transcriptional regulator [Nonomuraea glycinis]
MSRQLRAQDAQCSIAQAAAVIGDWWSLLIVREVARGHRRFEDLLGELGISRKVLTERLKHLVEHGVLTRDPYQTRPVRHEYVLTDTGWALAPLLITMQDWADRWLLGDGALTALPESHNTETARVHGLLGTRIPAPLSLPATHPSGEPGQTSTEPRPDGTAPISSEVDGVAGAGWSGVRDVVADAGATVLFGYPATGMPGALPPQWGDIPGTMGCTLENRLFRDRLPEFAVEGIAVNGVSTQRPDEQAAFAEAEGITFPLLSDMDLRLAAALRLPTFRAGQAIRLKRLILVVDRLRVVRHVIFPVLDIPTAITQSLTAARAVTQGRHTH